VPDVVFNRDIHILMDNNGYMDIDGNFHGEEDTRIEPVRQITPRTNSNYNGYILK
jgi:hypothetical protein